MDTTIISCIPHPISHCPCFRKIFGIFQTGTLTEGNLDLKGVVESRSTGLGDMVDDPTLLALDSHLVQAMATCHSLIKLKGKITGNPLDVKLFEALEWVRKH